MDVSNDSYYEEVDEDFESQKKLIEEELQKIVMQDNDPDMVADKILSAAESIQKLADNYGHDDINLSPSIDRIKRLKGGQSEEMVANNECLDDSIVPVNTKLQEPSHSKDKCVEGF